MPTVTMHCAHCRKVLINQPAHPYGPHWWVHCVFCQQGNVLDAAQYGLPPSPDVWKTDPTNIELYPEPFKSQAIKIIQSISEAMAAEMESLDQFGLPRPILKTFFEIEPVLNPTGGLTDIHIKPPSFDWSFVTSQKLHVKSRHPGLVYWAVHDPESGKQAKEWEKEIEQLSHIFDFPAIIERFPGHWLSRHPYEFFYDLNRRSSQPFAASKHAEYLTTTRYPPWHQYRLERQPALSVAEARRIEVGLSLLHEISDGCQWNQDALYEARKCRYWLYAPDKELPTRVMFELAPPDFASASEQVTLKVLPSGEVRPTLMAQLFENLRAVREPFTFALVAANDAFSFQIVCAVADRPTIEHNLRVLFPDFSVIEADPPPVLPHAVKLRPKTHHHTLKTLRDFAQDPFGQFFTLLDEAQSLDPAVSATVELHCAPVHADTLAEIIKEFERSKKWCEENDKDLEAKLLADRIKPLQAKQPPWALGVTIASTDAALTDMLTAHGLRQYETIEQKFVAPRGNARVKYECIENLPWALASTDELIALAHFPDRSITVDRLETVKSASRQPPDLYTKPEPAESDSVMPEPEYIDLGTSTHRHQTREVILPNVVRDRHVYVVGKTRTGKSTLVFNMARQDIEAGRGVAVIDPHGDLVEDLLPYIPKHRVQDTIYFNAAADPQPHGLNPFVATSEREVSIIADDLIVTFKRFSESWGDRFENILRYTFHTLLRIPGSGFLDIQTILQNPAFRERIVSQLEAPALRDFWQQQYPVIAKTQEAVQPILNRMSKFMLSQSLHAVLAERKPTLNFGEILRDQKILLVNLSQGQTGEDASHLLGSLVVSQFQMAAMRRAGLSKEARTPFYLYVDEFQNFLASPFDKILAEAGKYKLCLTLAHQYISQLDDKTRASIFGNVGTVVIFSLGFQDAKFLKPELGQFSDEDVVNLDRGSYEAFCRPATKASDTFKFKTLAPPPRPAENFVEEIIRQHAAPVPTPEPVEPPTTPPPIEPAAPPKPEPEPVADAQPVKAEPKWFPSVREKILYYLAEAEYLSTRQIIELCFAQQKTEASRKANAARELGALEDGGQIKSDWFGGGKIYSLKACNPTAHNLAVRDLYVKIVRSGFELVTVEFFCTDVAGLSPDLAVSFRADAGAPIQTYWEYDVGGEGLDELRSKLSRYAAHQRPHRVCFVVPEEPRREKLMRHLAGSNISFAVLDQFSTLQESAFCHSADGGAVKSSSLPFFTLKTPLDNSCNSHETEDLAT